MLCAELDFGFCPNDNRARVILSENQTDPRAKRIDCMRLPSRASMKPSGFRPL